jgi:hypothetical protein
MDVRRLVGGFVALGFLGGCGSGADAMRSADADALHRQVAAVRTALARDRPASAASAAGDLRARIQGLARSGELDPADALVLLTQVEAIATGIEARGTSTPSATPSPTPTAAAPTRAPTRATANIGRTFTDTKAAGGGKAKGKKRGHGHG